MFRHTSESLEPHVRCVVHTHLHPVIAGRAKPQQPSQQSGRTALSGKQEGVREEGDGHRGAELGGCLSSSRSLLSTLLSITHSSPSKYFSLSFLPHREKKSRKKKTQQLYQKNLSATLGGGARTAKPEWTLPCLPMHFRETGEGKSILYLFPVFTFIFFYCMMWHKLLLTEFVIYLWLEWCCLCFTDSFPSPSFFPLFLYYPQLG